MILLAHWNYQINLSINSIFFNNDNLKEEVEITTSKRYVSTYEDGRCTLIINNITVEEEAEFTCKATNEAGSCTTFVDIFVERKTFTSILDSLLIRLIKQSK